MDSVLFLKVLTIAFVFFFTDFNNVSKYSLSTYAKMFEGGMYKTSESPGFI